MLLSIKWLGCNYMHVKHYNNVARLVKKKARSNLKRSTHIDMIGPPDPVSNLRPIKFAKPKNETSLEKTYRELREDTQRWNQHFWTKHNTSFIEEREQFRDNLKSQGKELITADDMSVFYKQFLDKNWGSHFHYNIALYKRNIKLLILAFRVRISKVKFK